jgi:hypothetical protein
LSQQRSGGQRRQQERENERTSNVQAESPSGVMERDPIARRRAALLAAWAIRDRRNPEVQALRHVWRHFGNFVFKEVRLFSRIETARPAASVQEF